ncbi:MAG TPA: hypothetical protein DCR43_09050 [Bacteroidales bacterium]|nr:MAG: hypothetical protein A2X11_05175 [Bacteroidetes bacterium GWE2_42_24]OFY26591.1 MAG: hypothetical protein A2X09_03395 [Bacteroidetes bacterium GWF2_43_11]PKP16472.1 MAG: hypothetical protein CVU06_14610 [Bacteroidetes bacterium HGW-Bacteroidetes-22]HAQ65980.1 hypothetical protein [Bacteroidales bacterium]HBZ67470.1 hypothetical protein [Bacteroidales bacterium]
MSNVLLADSGSSKTDWVLVAEGVVVSRFQSAGLNPYFLSPDRITEEIRKSLPGGFDTAIPDEVFFYGSGCTAPERLGEVRGAIRAVFPYTEVWVDSDLLGAARALFGLETGLVGILGTGSNVCLYDGNQITAGIRSLGFLFGDWGSGAVIGKELVTCYLRKEMPEPLLMAFEKWHGQSFEQILERSYRNERPSRYLASFVPFLSQHKDDQWVSTLLKDSFDDFFRYMVYDLPQPKFYPFGAIGSVAFYFQDFLCESALKAGFDSIRVLAAPIDGLISFHGNQGTIT